MIGVSVLGSTGSIGISTLDVVGRYPDRFRIVALTANRDVDGMLQQIRRHRPPRVAMANRQAAAELRMRLSAEALATEVLEGPEALEELAALPEADYVMAAIVGAAGLLPTLAAVRAGKRVMLANKEALVVSGRLLVEAVRASGATLLPIDSEHNAIFQCLPQGFDGDLAAQGVRRLLLTASGGPFRTWGLDELAGVSPEQACAHPNWQMGRKISVDSATMMNKGLEVIEAHWLFGVSADEIQVVIHPQSVIHSLVEYVDGSVLAQMGNPDMRTPIAHALAWPRRIAAGVAPLDLFDVARLEFEPPDDLRFPCLRLAFEALRSGGAAPAVLNAANEVAVQAFLERRIGFTDISRLIETSLERYAASTAAGGLDDLLALDGEVREYAERRVVSGV